MKLEINGEELEVQASTMAGLLAELEYDHEFLATARNSDLVPSEEWESCLLSEGDRIEILSPMQGG